MLGFMWQKDTYTVAVFCGSLPAAFGRCEHIISFPLVCLSLGCPRVGPGLVVYSAWASNPPRSGEPGNLMKSCPCAAVCWEGCLPPIKPPSVSPAGCALSPRVCPGGCQALPVGATLLCASYHKFLTQCLPYPVYPTVEPSVGHTSSTLIFSSFNITFGNRTGFSHLPLFCLCPVVAFALSAVEEEEVTPFQPHQAD
jgi:hypothetical protein